ncbi:ribosomal protein S18 [Aspergillus unguis]
MSLNLFASSPFRTLASTLPAACRFNSTASKNPSNALRNILQPSQSASGSRPARPFRQTSPRSRMAQREEQRLLAENRALEKYQVRNWKAGDIYAPHDLSPTEMRKWSKRSPPSTDAFDALNLNPLSVYKNFNIMSEYMTEMGRIRHSKMTGLRPVNQRKMAKAIRRAIGVGLMPSVHRHPMILAELKYKNEGPGGNV